MNIKEVVILDEVTEDLDRGINFYQEQEPWEN